MALPILDGGHAHTEAAASTLGDGTLVASVVGFVVVIAILGYGISRYADR